MRWGRREFLKAGGIAGLGTTLAGVSGYLYGTRLETEWLTIERVEIPLARLHSRLEGLRIVLLSDFHLYPNTRLEFIERVAQRAAALKPDLVVLTGDFVQRYADAIFDLSPVLARIGSPLGSFCVLGNHDHWKGAEVVRQGLRESRLTLLENRGTKLAFRGAEFYLAGVDDCWSGNPDLNAALRDYPGGMPLILLSHEPDPADQYAADDRIDLQLSGHSHGGQVRIPGIGSPFLPPHGKKYDLGIYRVGGMWLYTNRGIGVTVPIRLNCPPEITEVTLVSGGTGSAARLLETRFC